MLPSFASLRSSTKADPRTAAVLIYEFDAGGFQSFPQLFRVNSETRGPAPTSTLFTVGKDSPHEGRALTETKRESPLAVCSCSIFSIPKIPLVTLTANAAGGAETQPVGPDRTRRVLINRRPVSTIKSDMEWLLRTRHCQCR
jgi:hypothetical protein